MNEEREHGQREREADSRQIEIGEECEMDGKKMRRTVLYTSEITDNKIVDST